MFDRVFNDDKSKDTEEIDIQNIDKNYKLKNGNYFHFHTNEEGYYYEIYDQFGFEQDGGLLEYSEIDNGIQSLKDIRLRLAEFSGITELTNNTLESVTQDLIDNLSYFKFRLIFF